MEEQQRRKAERRELYGLAPVLENSVEGEFHDQGDAKWIVIRGQLRGHDTPCGRPAPGRLIGCPGSAHPQGVFGGFSYY
jgi:hypothetical protein